jgi:thiol-disulfide isomerase/thioredoxin
VLGVAILGGVIGLAVSSSHSSTAGDSTSPQAFVLPRLGAAGKVRLASYRGTPVVVNFFASWCTQCAGELPVFSQDARSLRGKVDFIEVNALETGDGLSFAQRFGLPSSVTAVASDVGGSQGDGLYQALGGSGSMPMTAFYSASGSLLTTHLGAYDATTLSGQLDQLYGINAA